MESQIAYCGLVCNKCPVHLATLEQNETRRLKLRKEIAEQCSNLYKKVFLPEDIADCDGCRSTTGRLLAGCLNCEIRKCAIGMNIDNCAFCSDYICEILDKHLSFENQARERLEALRGRNCC